MNKRFAAALVVSLAAAFATSAHAEPPARMVSGKLVDSAGMTLYVFDRDVPGSGKSACSNACPAIWPPAAVAPDAKAEGDFSIITRDNGSKQWAYRGRPLYLHNFDKKPGEVNGDNQGNLWHVVK
jgi:predicted lipoprotein with Yx(FWY)xxD motif